VRPLRLPRLSLPLFLAVAALPALARAQATADSAKAKPDSARARRDTVKSADLFGQKTDLGLQLNGRFESKLEKTKNDRCIASQFFTLSQCQASFQPNVYFQFDVRTGGTVADRVHLNVDYDSRREFDASNRISLFYEGKPRDWLQRLDVGNVSLDVPTSRFITAGIPQGNYGVQAVAKIGDLRVRAIVAQQAGNVVRDRVFTVGSRTQQRVDRDIEDYQVEARRFFFTVDPRRFAGYPNVDILNGVQMRQLAAALPDSVRPVHVTLYRLLIGGQPPNPNGPQFRIIGDPSSRRGQIYEVLRENVDYYADPSQLWVALVQPLNLNNERLVVAYTVRVNGRDTTIATTGGTPDVQFAATRPQFAALLWDPQVRPGDPAFFRELRSVYRVGGEDVRRETIGITIVTGATGELEKPLGGSAETFLQLFGLAQGTNPSAFDADNRLWPRPGDPVFSLGGTANTRVIRDQFLVFPSLQPFARAGLAQPAQNPSNDAIYSTPGEYLYSPQHPQSLYRIRVRYESDGGGDGARIALPSTQLRPGSERLTLDDGFVLRRDLDYVVDYDLGTVTFLHADTLFARPRNVTVKYEETPLVASVPTSIFGIASTLPLRYGELNFVGIAQRQSSTFTRPPLGYEDQSALIAGVNGALTFDARTGRGTAGRREPPCAGAAPGRGRVRDQPTASRRREAGLPRDVRRPGRHLGDARRSELVPLEPAGARDEALRANRRRLIARSHARGDPRVAEQRLHRGQEPPTEGHTPGHRPARERRGRRRPATRAAALALALPTLRRWRVQRPDGTVRLADRGRGARQAMALDPTAARPVRHRPLARGEPRVLGTGGHGRREAQAQPDAGHRSGRSLRKHGGARARHTHRPADRDLRGFGVHGSRDRRA
jgi:hypothetical protein